MTGTEVPLLAAEFEAAALVRERAAVAAAGYTAAVGTESKALADAGISNPVRAAAKANAYRLDRIAATENATAFNDARSETIRASAKAAGIKLYEVWDATLDKRTCPECSSRDGTVADERGEFAGGARPGWVHVGCRCSSHMTTTKP